MSDAVEGHRVGIVGLGARVHLFLRPEARAPFLELFQGVLGCQILERDFGFEHPILLAQFPDGSGFSVELTDLAPAAATVATISDRDAFRGPWLEFRTPELERLQAALRSAGVPEFRHPGSRHAYFVAPGGQVFRLLDLDDTGP